MRHAGQHGQSIQRCETKEMSASDSGRFEAIHPKTCSKVGNAGMRLGGVGMGRELGE